jgi:hypothetical protein
MNPPGRRVAFSCLLLIGLMPLLAAGDRPVVAYLTAGPLTNEDRAAASWLGDVPEFRVEIVDLSGRSGTGSPRKSSKPPGGTDPSAALLGRAAGADILWVHLPDEASLLRWRRCPPAMEALRAAVGRGAPILLTDCAALLPGDLGLEPHPPELRLLEIKDDWLFEQKGLQGFRGHPVFAGLFGGAFLWDGDRDRTLPTVGFFGGNWPEKGRVIGIEKSYVHLDPDRRLLVEYPAEAGGKVLAVGGFVYFQPVNSLRLNLERFVLNCLNHLTGRPGTTRATFWEPAAGTPREFSVQSDPLRPPRPETWAGLPESGPCIGRMSSAEFFDLAGRRSLIMGSERGGIREFWVHPFRVFRNFQAGLIMADGVHWLEEFPVRLEIRPESLTRIYDTPAGPLREIVWAALEEPGGLVRYEASFREPARLLVTCRSDLRWMWPYDAGALGDIHYAFDEGLGAFHVRDRSGDFYGLLGADIPPSDHLAGPFDAIEWRADGLTGTPGSRNEVALAAVYPLGPESAFTLTVGLAGTDRGQSEALAAFRSLLQDPRLAYEKMVKHCLDLFENRVMIESPDPEFNRLWPWALVGADRFVVKTPGLGTALTAGYSTCDRGWDGGQAVSGRPGYAWYFGRDAEWSGFALDECGDFATVRNQLELFQKFQDGRGKIFHELTTSGVVHYDAADATPLYIVLAADYLRASGDADFIRRSWPHLKKAMDFLYSTDTDGDGLIENTGVGHGWVEGGKLAGAHTTLYLAACWARALGDAAELAAACGHKELAFRYRRDREKVRRRLEADFWNPATRFYNYGKLKDGGFNPEPTVLPAVAMLFGLLEDEKAGSVLETYAGNGFSADWGVRILSAASPLYNPEGYHYGSVWPLFTGWTALAEYRYGRSAQGFAHLMDNLLIKNHWAAGFVEEVMNGAVYKPSGVCPHQCWSETDILLPAVAGMVGWAPDAPRAEATLSPRFPLHWDRATVRNLRVGASVIELAFIRTAGRTTYRLILREGPAVTVRLAPELATGAHLREVTVDGRTVVSSGRDKRGLLAQPLVLHLVRTTEVVLRHSGGVGMAPVVARPEPDDSSQGYRIIRESLLDGVFEVLLEGKSGTTGTFQAMLFDQSAREVTGATVAFSDAGGRITLQVPFPAAGQSYSQATVRIRLESGNKHDHPPKDP